MAAVFIPPSPQTSLNMSTRRPLANVPNATNSPHRAGLVPAKRGRPAQIEIPFGQPPPKKQVTEAPEPDARSPTRTRSTVYHGADSKLFARRSNNPHPSAFEKKLVAARDKERQPQAKGTKTEKPSTDTLDTIRQWQRHYRKAFPQFVFYFDSIQEEVRRKCSRQVIALGAREEKFFSRLVTHVVTSRPVPPEAATTSPAELESGADTGNGDGHMQTVNPSLLEKNADAHLHMSLKPEHRRDQGSMDVLQRARQMGMKIWALEKLQRMIATINDSEIGSQHDTSRNKTAGGSTVHGKGENDLSRVLRQELLNGPSDRDPLSSMEMLIFKGPFVYIHDMNEKTKPVMVREYSRVARRQDGTWPQFRSAPLGKCPFIDEPPTRKSYDRQRMRQQQKEKKAVMTKVDNLRGANHTTTITERATETKPVKDIARPRSQENLGQRVSPPMQTELQRKPSLEGPHKRKSSESFIPPHFPPKGPFYAGREPAASGVQPSNITSAIRSQMISSTAAAPGAKAGLSKEVHGLKRKLLEKGTGSIVTGSMAAPQRYANGSAMHQSVKRQGHQAGNSNLLDKHRHANADANQADDTGAKRHRDETLDSQQKKSQPPRDPKPGYCENCRDKFDDFEEHTLTRKHRRFAANATNWAELDALLFEIQRPFKDDYEYDN